MPLADHVGLVVEAAGNRDVDDATGRAQEQTAGTLEPKNPRRRFRRDAELTEEALAEMAPTEADLARERVNGPASMTDRQAAPGPRHGIGHRHGSQPSQERSIDCRKSGVATYERR